MANALSPDSQAFMDMLETQLQAEERGRNNHVSSSAAVPQLNPYEITPPGTTASSTANNNNSSSIATNANPNGQWDAYMPQLQKLQEMFAAQQQQLAAQPGPPPLPQLPTRHDSGASTHSTSSQQQQQPQQQTRSATSMSSAGGSGGQDSSPPPPYAPAMSPTQQTQHFLNLVTQGTFGSFGNASTSRDGGSHRGGQFIPFGIMPTYGPSPDANANARAAAVTPPTQQSQQQQQSSSASPPVAGPSRHNSEDSQQQQGSAATATGNKSGSTAPRRKSTKSLTRPPPPERGSSDPAMDVDHKRKADDEEVSGHMSHRKKSDGANTSHSRRDSLTQHDQDDQDLSSDDGGGGGSKRSGRKKTSSGGNGGGDEMDDAQARALKRKNQNRAAQKAFRERREQRVKDLEDKVSELEAKNYGQNIENENLRQLLSKLQQENMALKNSAFSSSNFTFSMPVNGLTPTSTRDSPSAASNAGSHPPAPGKRSGDPHLPSPPSSTHTIGGGSEDASALEQMRSHSGSSSKSSPANTASSSAQSPAQATTSSQVFHPDAFNAFVGSAPVQHQSLAQSSPHDSIGAASSSANLNVQDILGALRDTNQEQSSAAPREPYQDWAGSAPFTMISQAPEMTSFQEMDWAQGLGDNAAVDDATMADFLRSLTDASADQNSAVQAQAEQEPRHMGPSWLQPSSAAGLNIGSDLFSEYLFGSQAQAPSQTPGRTNTSISPFSSGNYFQMSPETNMSSLTTPPLSVPSSSASINKQQSSSSDGSMSNAFCPESAKVVRADGTELKPAELWEKVSSRVSFESGFDLDALCVEFKQRAICDGSECAAYTSQRTAY